MASTPHPSPKPSSKPAPHDPNTLNLPLETRAEDELDPNRIITVGEEQMARSQEMQKVGIYAYMDEHADELGKAARKTVAGVAPPPPPPEVEHHGRR